MQLPEWILQENSSDWDVCAPIRGALLQPLASLGSLLGPIDALGKEYGWAKSSNTVLNTALS